MDEMISNRIKRIMEDSQLNATQFATAIGITRSNLAHIFSGRNQPSFAMLEKILRAFPEIRSEWLVTGIGDMTKSADELEATQNSLLSKQPAASSIQTELLFDELPLETHELPHITAPQPESVVPSPGPVTPEPISMPETAVTPAASPTPRPAVRRRPGRPEQTSGEKKIRKIVFFYTDHSFEEYFPE